MRRLFFCDCLFASRSVASSRERCSLHSCTGFEVFVPGRQSMAPAMNPVFRSANLIRCTVSHFLCRPHAQFLHVLRPNQSMKSTPKEFASRLALFRNKLTHSLPL